MTILTFLGMLDGEKARYRFSPPLGKALGIASTEAFEARNMLPLLVERFGAASVVAVGTEDSVRKQKEVLGEKAGSEVRWEALGDIQDYAALFRRMGDLLAEYDDVVVDITHSFRHIPALMVVDMVIANIRNPSKIRHILFAKELEKGRRYVVMDLREYLTLANVSYALASFTRNYTVATTVPTRNEIYQALLNELAAFGDHILANSLEALLFPERENRSIAGHIRHLIAMVREHPELKATISPLVRYLEEIDDHMKEILQQADKPLDERYHYFADLMYGKGYMLNALTMLDEALAAYCVEGFRHQPTLKSAVERVERSLAHTETGSLYDLTNTAKGIVNYGNRFQKQFSNNLGKELVDALQSFVTAAKGYIDRNYKKTWPLRQLIRDCDNTRNNLAHANSAERFDDVRKEIRSLLLRYEEVCYEKDPLHRFAN